MKTILAKFNGKGKAYPFNVNEDVKWNDRLATEEYHKELVVEEVLTKHHKFVNTKTDEYSDVFCDNCVTIKVLTITDIKL